MKRPRKQFAELLGGKPGVDASHHDRVELVPSRREARQRQANCKNGLRLSQEHDGVGASFMEATWKGLVEEMNELLKTVVACKLSENATLDLLQEAGVISDLCLRLKDVAEQDCLKAILVLAIHMHRPKLKGSR